MVDIPWDVFFWSALGPGWGDKKQPKALLVEEEGRRRWDQRGEGDAERVERPEKRKRDQPGLALGYPGPCCFNRVDLDGTHVRRAMSQSREDSKAIKHHHSKPVSPSFLPSSPPQGPSLATDCSSVEELRVPMTSRTHELESPGHPPPADGGMDGRVRKKTGDNGWSSWSPPLLQDRLASRDTMLYLLQ